MLTQGHGSWNEKEIQGLREVLAPVFPPRGEELLFPEINLAHLDLGWEGL